MPRNEEDQAVIDVLNTYSGRVITTTPNLKDKASELHREANQLQVLQHTNFAEFFHRVATDLENVAGELSRAAGIAEEAHPVELKGETDSWIPQERHIEDLIPIEGIEAASRPFRQKPAVIIIHSTRSTRSEPTWTGAHERSATINSYKSGANNSSHAVIEDNGVIWWTVALDRMAWGAEYLNGIAYHIEVCQATINTPFTALQYMATAFATKKLAARSGIPLVKINYEVGSGYLGHEDTAQGKSCGKSDPGPAWDWKRFAKLLR